MRWDLWVQLPNGTLSISPVDVNWCQKLNHEFQSSLVGLSKGYLNVDSVVVPPGLKTKFLRYRPSAVVISDRNIGFSAPLHLPRPLIVSGLKPSAWKISIMTWSLSRGRGVVGKAIWRCISKCSNNRQSIFTQDNGAKCPHLAYSRVKGLWGVPN